MESEHFVSSGMDRQTTQHDLGLERESVPELVSQVITHSKMLVQQEIDLAKQELREQLDIFRTGVIRIAAGAIVCLLGLISLCGAAILALTVYLTLTMAALSVGIALIIIGALIAFFGSRYVKKVRIEANRLVH